MEELEVLEASEELDEGDWDAWVWYEAGWYDGEWWDEGWYWNESEGGVGTGNDLEWGDSDTPTFEQVGGATYRYGEPSKHITFTDSPTVIGQSNPILEEPPAIGQTYKPPASLITSTPVSQFEKSYF